MDKIKGKEPKAWLFEHKYTGKSQNDFSLKFYKYYVTMRSFKLGKAWPTFSKLSPELIRQDL